MAYEQEGQEVFLQTLQAENAEMEAEIAKLTQKSKAAASTTCATKHGPSGLPSIQIYNYGTAAIADEAGKNLGTAWRPAVCSRRTLSGAMFTS